MSTKSVVGERRLEGSASEGHRLMAESGRARAKSCAGWEQEATIAPLKQDFADKRKQI
jgi:hypothetical protein